MTELTQDQWIKLARDVRTAFEEAYRIGWEARGKRDAEVCREQFKNDEFSDIAHMCAIAIEREGKR